MSLGQRLLAKIRLLVGADKMDPKTGIFIPGPDRIDPEKALDAIAAKVVQQHALIMALLEEREGYRTALTGIAMEYGLTDGKLSDFVVMAWPNEEAPAKKEAAPEAKALTLH